MPLNRQFSGAIEVGRERSDSTPFLERWCSCMADEQSATMVAKLAIWINVVQFIVDFAASAVAGAETTVARFHGSVDTIPGETLTLLKWYHWQVLMAMSVVVYLNASAISLAESSPIDLPLLILDFMDVPLLALSVWALYTMEQQVSLTPAPMLY